MTFIKLDNLVFNVNEAIAAEKVAREEWGKARATLNTDSSWEAAYAARDARANLHSAVATAEELGFMLRDELASFLSARGADKCDGSVLLLPPEEEGLVLAAARACLRASPRITARGIPACTVGNVGINIWDGEFGLR